MEITGTKLSLKEKMSYACGDAASNVVWAAMGTFIMFYYTDVAHVSAAAIGTILLISRLLDGMSDIIMGMIVDRTKSRFGKARAWLLRMAIPFAIATFAVFAVPDFGEKGKLIYIFITYNLVMTCYTMINLPYGTLSTLMTQDQYQRSLLNIFRQIFAQITSLIITSCTLPLINVFENWAGNTKTAWGVVYGIFGAAAAVLFLICFAGTKERVGVAANKRESVPIGTALKALLKNRYWIMSTLLGTGTCLFYMAVSTVNTYYCKSVLHSEAMVGTLNAAYIIPTIITFFILAPIVKKVGKRYTNMLGWIIILAGYAVLLPFTESIPVLMVTAVMRGIGYSCIMGVQFAIIGDSVEYGEWKTGVRTEGLVFSAQSFGCKLGMGLGNALIGVVLDMSRYNGDLGFADIQPSSAIFAIKALYIAMPAVVAILQIIMMGIYKLDKLYPQIMKDLIARQGKEA